MKQKKSTGDLNLKVKDDCPHDEERERILNRQIRVESIDEGTGIKSVHLDYCPKCHAIIDDSFIVW